MVYQIKTYSYEKAKKLNVEIKPSNKKDKKIDVYKDKKYICSIGDIHYYDYPTYKNNGLAYANERRKLYKIRHNNKDRNIKNSSGFFADRILW